MAYTVYSNNKIDWNAKGVNRVLQNVVNLLNTYRYEVGYNRTMGRDPVNIDKPLDKMVPAIIAETYDLIQQYEPRAKVKDVEVICNNGDPIIKVVLEIV